MPAARWAPCVVYSDFNVCARRVKGLLQHLRHISGLTGSSGFPAPAFLKVQASLTFITGLCTQPCGRSRTVDV